MDFINQATNQLRELMLSMTPAARITAALLVGVIVVSLGFLVQHQAASPDEFLFNGEFLPGSVMDRVEGAIAQKNLSGYERIGNRIKVPSGRKAEFLAAVADGGALPPNFHSIMDEALNISAFASSDVRRQKFKSAREQQISLLVSNMAGIEQATVMFDVTEARGLNMKGDATASVSVLPAPGATLGAQEVKNIKQAVAAMLVELKPENVVVTNSGDGSILGSSGGEVSAASFDNEYYQTRIAFERNMQDKIAFLLRDIPGVLIQVTAELEDTLERTSQSNSPDGEGVAVVESEQTETDKISEVDNGGRPGLDAQGPQRNNNDQAAVTVLNDRQNKVTESQNAVGTKQEYHRFASLVPRGVRAAIAVPRSYLLSVWRENQRLQGADLTQPLPSNINELLDAVQVSVEDKINTLVLPLLPKELGTNPFSGVQISFIESLTPPPIEEQTTASQLLAWAGQNFNTMTMAVVALVSLMMLRSMVKSIPYSEPAAAIKAPTLALDTIESAADQESEANEVAAGRRPKLKLKKGDSLKEDLVDIVKDDPDAAAAILRSWIGNAG